MADNVAYTPGSGIDVAADDLSGVFYQRVKISVGADGTAVDVSAAAPLPVNEIGCATATLTAVASATSSAQVLASTATRRGLTLYNNDANGVYVKFGTTASATSFTVLIPSNGYWEAPAPIYTGRIDAIWIGNGAGSLYVSEMTL